MRYFILLFLLFTNRSMATGFPVVDTNQVIGEIKDHAYLVDSVTELVEEVGVAGEEVQYLVLLQSQLSGLADDLRTLHSFNEDVADLGNFKSIKGEILADRIRSFTDYLRKLKRVVATASTIGARPQAMLVSLQMLEQSRQRENDRMEAKMMAADEMDKVDEKRAKIKREIAQREQSKYEKDLIFNRYGQNKDFAPLQVKVDGKKNNSKGLM